MLGKRWTARPGEGRPWGELERLRQHVDKIYDALVEGVETFRRTATGVYPPINMSEDADHLYITAELPGVTGVDVELSIRGQDVILRGERKIPEADANVNYHRRERESGLFRRAFTLPVRVDADKVQAAFRDGVLEVTLPKAVEAKARRISIEND